MAYPSTVRALRILLYVLMSITALCVVGIALGYYPGSALLSALSLLPAAAVAAHVFYLRPGRGVLRITLTVTLSVYTIGTFYNLVEGGSGAIIGVILGASMLVLLHQQSTREWFAGTASEPANYPQQKLGSGTDLGV